ncbi:putative alpha-1,3-mannosyltransferase [Clavispora lusitaniae]|uniref:Alpha-1,3-mannosyltransferase n=1 Tax=Clavispora lusitaniae TaxID=36911 RepID=A0AA91T1V3_CLALS|nr:putative alpha-1,3-mannosyltransferase [Clavispora lusitaniae]
MAMFRKKRFLLLVAIATVGFMILQFTSFARLLKPPLPYSDRGFFESDYETRAKVHFSNYQYSGTESFGRRLGEKWEHFAQRPLHEKCVQFFSAFEQDEPKWKLHRTDSDRYDKYIVHKQKFFERSYGKLKKQKEKAKSDNPEDVTDLDKQEIDAWYTESIQATENAEQSMADSMTVLRLFAHCFYGPEGDKIRAAEDARPLYESLSRRLVPIFSPYFPMIHQTDGTLLQDRFPESSVEFNYGDNLLDFYRQNVHGSGIVISGATRYVKHILKFIRLLRVMNNRLPIQIIFRNDLSEKAKKVLYAVATRSKEEMFNPVFTDQKLMQKMYPGFDMDHETVKSLEFPPQDITLINIHRSISPDHQNDYTGYNNKILALFFSTFQNVLLYDADSVPLVPPQEILDANEFRDNGAYFFRDRSLRDSNDWLETNYFAKLMPHTNNVLDMAMGVRPVTNHTMKNAYMTGWRHFQEAGLLALDKRRHFGMFLPLFALALWEEPVQSSIWGDKEMYWLAMSIVGDEQYHMNKYAAASVGQKTEEGRFKLYNNTRANELCSSHPGHVNSAGKLLWINSGFSYCKKNGYVRDSRKFPFSAMEDRKMVEDLYRNPLLIRHAIVPPDLPDLRTSDSPDLQSEIDLVELVRKRKKDVDDLPDEQIDGYDPQKGWIKSSCCSNYQYCAYDAIESYSNPGTLDTSGTLFTFSEDEAARFDFLGTVWTTGNRPASIPDGSKVDTAQEKSKDEENKTAFENQSSNNNTLFNVRERPEKLRNDIKALIADLLKKSETSSRV